MNASKYFMAILVGCFFLCAYLGVMCAVNEEFAYCPDRGYCKVEFVNDSTLLITEKVWWIDPAPFQGVWEGQWNDDLTVFVCEGSETKVIESTDFLTFEFSEDTNVYRK